METFKDEMGLVWNSAEEYIKFMEDHGNNVGAIVPLKGENILWNEEVLAAVQKRQKKNRMISIGVTGAYMALCIGVPYAKKIYDRYKAQKARTDALIEVYYDIL